MVFFTPIGFSSDEDFHLASIYCTGQNIDFCIKTDTSGKIKTFAYLHMDRFCWIGNLEQNANCSAIDKYYSIKDNKNLLTDVRFSEQSYDVFSYYYRIANQLISSGPIDSIFRIKFINVALFFLIFVISYRKIDTKGYLVTLFFISNPLISYNVVSIHPISWTLTGIYALVLSHTYLKIFTFDLVTHLVRLLGIIMLLFSREENFLIIFIYILILMLINFEVSSRIRLLYLLFIFLLFSILIFKMYTYFPRIPNPNISGFLWHMSLLFGLTGWRGPINNWGLGWAGDFNVPLISVLMISIGIVFFYIKLAKLKLFLLALALITFFILSISYLSESATLYFLPRHILPFSLFLLSVSIVFSKKDISDLKINSLKIILGFLFLGNIINTIYLLNRFVFAILPGVATFLYLLIPSSENGYWWWDIPVSPGSLFIINSLALFTLLFIIFRFLRDNVEIYER